MTDKADIQSLGDIQLLVNSFYAGVRKNELLGPIFNERIGDRWPEHLEKMYRFWQTVLLGEHSYFGSPFPPHAQLPVDQAHFDTWLLLWHETIDHYFQGKKADEAKWRGDKMAAMFLSKITYYRGGSARPLV